MRGGGVRCGTKRHHVVMNHMHTLFRPPSMQDSMETPHPPVEALLRVPRTCFTPMLTPRKRSPLCNELEAFSMHNQSEQSHSDKGHCLETPMAPQKMLWHA